MGQLKFFFAFTGGKCWLSLGLVLRPFISFVSLKLGLQVLTSRWVITNYIPWCACVNLDNPSKGSYKGPPPAEIDFLSGYFPRSGNPQPPASTQIKTRPTPPRQTLDVGCSVASPLGSLLTFSAFQHFSRFSNRRAKSRASGQALLDRLTRSTCWT